MAHVAAVGAGVPVAIHLDHGASFALTIQAIRHGFTSVMIDGSQLPYDENVALTRQAFTPEGGLENYLRSHAPDLKRLAEQGDMRPQFDGDRMELRASAGAVWYTFGPDGRITGIGQEGVK